jgi:hypothetical protein
MSLDGERQYSKEHRGLMNTCISFKLLASAFALAPLCTLACGDHSSDGFSDELIGSADLQLSEIPPDVRCFQVRVAGPKRTEVRTFDVTPGQSSQSFRLDRLPLGNDEFSGAAYPVSCAEVTASVLADWVSDPVLAAVLRGVVTQVTLSMKRNGVSNVDVGFDDDELCSADEQPCAEDVDCCSVVCTSGTCAPAACSEQALIDLALNPSCSGFPSPLSSDAGWGGGSYPCDLVDGVHSYSTWARGLAFTGGHQDATGGPPYIEPAGVRRAVIDFGETKTFQKVVMWWHGAEHTPASGTLELWNGDEWLEISNVTRTYGETHAEGENAGYSDSDAYTFPPVTGSKVRYSFDNSGNNVLNTYNVHGWLYSMEVFGCPNQ